MMYYPIVRHRCVLDREYIQNEVDHGVTGFNSFDDANEKLKCMDTDDSDYEICLFDGKQWCATRNGIDVIKRFD